MAFYTRSIIRNNSVKSLLFRPTTINYFTRRKLLPHRICSSNYFPFMSITRYNSMQSTATAASNRPEKRDFQAETQKLLDIVANALYSDREVFLRELISNASDALEKLRYLRQKTSSPILGADGHSLVQSKESIPFEIHIKTDEKKHTLSVEDTGIGFTHQELVDNLGIIAKSGSNDFLKSVDDSSNKNHDNKVNDTNTMDSIIGQFGVGFYAAFMVSDEVQLFTRSYHANSKAYLWQSNGIKDYEIVELTDEDALANQVPEHGTKVLLHLKQDCYEFAKEEKVKEIIKKYSNFVGVPILLNDCITNAVTPIWMKDINSVTDEEHLQFYHNMGGLPHDKPRYIISYKTDAPIDIRALLYVPTVKQSLFEASTIDQDSGVALYCRKVMIQSRNQDLLPKWCRFLRGVIDSEDIPLNLSRELLQNSSLLRQIRRVLTSRIIKYFSEQLRRDPRKYREFYEGYNHYLKEAIISTSEQDVKEDISKLLLFESNRLPANELTSLKDYARRMAAGKRKIYYLCSRRRDIAESSPYYEALLKKEPEAEVLFLYEPYDEFILLQLLEFEGKNLTSVESELEDDAGTSNRVDAEDTNSISQSDVDDLLEWLEKTALVNKIKKAQATQRLSSHPCIVQVKEAAILRYHLKTTLYKATPEERFKIIDPVLEINPSHPLIRHLNWIRLEDEELANLLANQLLDNAMMQAELLDDPRNALGHQLNKLLIKMAEKMRESV